LTELLRGFAELPIAGLIIAFTDNTVDLGDEGEACEVLQGLAGHYDWFFALRLESTELSEGLEDLEADIRLLPTTDAEHLTDQNGPTGGGLNSTFWKGSAVPSAKRICLYGDVPVDVDPKVIVERVATLA